MSSIAIIGAGFAGLSCARRLAQAEEPVTNVVILDKSRGIGGRMATRYAGAYEFDHGAQYFTAKSKQFSGFVAEQEAMGCIAPWPETIETIGEANAREASRYVSMPRMNTLCKSMAEPFNVILNTHISGLDRTADGWRLHDKGGQVHGPFDYVVSAMPAPQMLVLMPEAFAGSRRALANVRMTGCFALMLGFEVPLEMPWRAARIGGSSVDWIAVNSDKPARGTALSVLVQSSNDWAEAHLEDDPESVQTTLLDVASELAGIDLRRAEHTALHRWRYAATPQPLGSAFLFDPTEGLAACGDWCLGSRVEAAFQSGTQLAEALLSEMASGHA